VGVLPPRKRPKSGPPPASTSHPSTPSPDAEAEETDGELLDGDELALGGSDSSQDGTTDLAPAQDKALIPSSFGMTFCVDPEATALQVIASWGQYERQPSAYLVGDKTGSPKRVWKRCPRGGTPYPFTPADGPFAPIALDPHCPEVIVQGLIRRRDTHWSVTLFLVNDQQEPERLRDTAWVFQPALTVEAPDRVSIFCNKPQPMELHGTDPLVKAENDLLAMLD